MLKRDLGLGSPRCDFMIEKLFFRGEAGGEYQSYTPNEKDSQNKRTSREEKMPHDFSAVGFQSLKNVQRRRLSSICLARIWEEKFELLETRK